MKWVYRDHSGRELARGSTEWVAFEALIATMVDDTPGQEITRREAVDLARLAIKAGDIALTHEE